MNSFQYIRFTNDSRHTATWGPIIQRFRKRTVHLPSRDWSELCFCWQKHNFDKSRKSKRTVHFPNHHIIATKISASPRFQNECGSHQNELEMQIQALGLLGDTTLQVEALYPSTCVHMRVLVCVCVCLHMCIFASSKFWDHAYPNCTHLAWQLHQGHSCTLSGISS